MLSEPDLAAAVFQSAAIAQLVIDPVEDQVSTANREACQLFGLRESALRQRPVSQLFAPSFPDMVVFSDEVLERGWAWADHLLIATESGAVRVEVSAGTMVIGSKTLLCLSMQTVDELARYRERSEAHRHYLSGIGHWDRVSKVFQEFERRNELILDAVGEGIYGVDANGITTFVNPAAVRILGYTADELAGRNMHSIIHHSHADGRHFCVEDCPIFEAFRDGTVHTEDDDVFWAKNGRRVDVEYTSTPIRDNGFIVGAVVIFRDVSQKKADRKRLLEALEEVESLRIRLELENAYLQEEISQEFNHHQIIGKSPALQNIVKQIKLVAATDTTVLISGESGTGKELIARAIHDTSDRSRRSLIRVNCAAIPADLFESEFFGHTKGAFTGAIADRPGRFELADGGTLFLDEVGEIPLHLQGKLLRVLQEQQFERIGESKTRNVDVRILAATNRDLKSLVAKGQFREDLYFRLNVFPIVSVPLRERRDDIPLLTQHLLDRVGARAKKSELRIPLSEMEKLKAYHWPGNVRELENVIERQVILARGDTIRFDGLQPTVQSVAPTSDANASTILTARELQDIDQRNLRLALERCQGKVFGSGGAAELLAMRPTTVASRLKKYRIDANQYKRL